jgi:hypothetical protein
MSSAYSVVGWGAGRGAGSAAVAGPPVGALAREACRTPRREPAAGCRPCHAGSRCHHLRGRSSFCSRPGPGTACAQSPVLFATPWRKLEPNPSISATTEQSSGPGAGPCAVPELAPRSSKRLPTVPYRMQAPAGRPAQGAGWYV